jgi:hypothetical protein
LIITEVLRAAVATLSCAREIAERETKLRQRGCADLLTARSRKLRKDPPVLSKNSVHVAYMVIIKTILFVMPRRATLIIAEFFVGTTSDTLPAFSTPAICFDGDHSLSFVIAIKIQANESPLDMQSGKPDRRDVRFYL